MDTQLSSLLSPLPPASFHPPLLPSLHPPTLPLSPQVINLLDALEEIDSVYKEIDVQRTLNHPNLLSLSAMYELNKEKFFLAMPLMSGGNLLEFVNDWDGIFFLKNFVFCW
jgi:serine/threonine protein kinase